MKVKFTIFDKEACEEKLEEFIAERTNYSLRYSAYRNSYIEELVNEFDKSPFEHEYSGEIAGTFFDGKCAMFAIALDDGTFVTHPVDKCKIYTDQPEDPEESEPNNQCKFCNYDGSCRKYGGICHGCQAE